MGNISFDTKKHRKTSSNKNLLLKTIITSSRQ